MNAILAGRKAVLTKGRRAGEQVEVTEVVDDVYVKVKTTKGKTRKANVMHLELL